MQNTQKHLTNEEIAMCADAINDGTFAQLPQRLRSHLQECDQCAEEVINVAEIASGTTDIQIPTETKDIPQVPKSLRGNNNKVVFGLAAAAAIVGFAIILNIPWDDNEFQETNDKQQVASTDQMTEDTSSVANQEKQSKKSEKISTPESKKDQPTRNRDQKQQKKLLANYEPNPRLEKLHKNMQGSFRGSSVEIITKPTLKYQKGDKLQWKNPNQKTLYLEIFNNQGKEIHRDTTTRATYDLQDLKPGLYYWKLISEDFELIHVGKIIIQQ